MDAFGIAAEVFPEHSQLELANLLISYTDFPTASRGSSEHLRAQLIRYRHQRDAGIEVCLGCGAEQGTPLAMDRFGYCRDCSGRLSSMVPSIPSKVAVTTIQPGNANHELD